MGAPGNQQAPKAHSSAQCAIQCLWSRAPGAIHRPSRANSVLTAAICVARLRGKRPSDPQFAAKAFFTRSVAILRPAAVVAYRFARKIARLTCRIAARPTYHLTRKSSATADGTELCFNFVLHNSPFNLPVRRSAACSRSLSELAGEIG